MDRASQALAQGLLDGRSLRAIADHSGVPRSTLHYRAHGRRSLQEKAQTQQYLTPYEEKAMVEFILQMAELGTPIRIKDPVALSAIECGPVSAFETLILKDYVALQRLATSLDTWWVD